MEGNRMFRILTRCIIVVLFMAWTINMNAQTKPTINRKPATPTKTTTNDTPPKKSSSKKTTPRSKTKRARKSTTLSTSSDHIFFNATGGTQTITVYSNADWHIGTSPNAWGHIRINGNQLSFTADPNNNHTSRTDYFTIVAGDKNLRINITQEKKESSLWLSNDKIYVSSSGDTKYITVDSDGEYWEISINTNSWGHLSRYGNTLTLKVDPNYSSTTRTDYFVVKSGNKTKRVDITQYGAPSSSQSQQSSSNNSYSTNTYSNNSYSNNTRYQYNYNDESWWKGRVSVGVELVGYVSGGSDFSDLLFYSYGAGLVLRIGKLSDVINLSTGCKWMRLAYNYEGDKGDLGNHIVVPGNLKFNIIPMGTSKFYLGGGFEYGIGLKKMPDFKDWNAGVGVNSRHIDGYLFYKQFIELFDDVYRHHIGTSITIYF